MYSHTFRNKKELDDKVKEKVNEIMYNKDIEYQLYNALLPLSRIPEYQRESYMREREDRKEEFIKSEYQYIYLKQDEFDNGKIVRTNGVYYQYKDFGKNQWCDAYRYAETIEKVEWSCKTDTFENGEIVEKLRTTTEIVKAMSCILSNEEYIQERKESILNF